MEQLAILIIIVIAGSATFSGIEAAIFAVSLAQAKILKERKKSGASHLIKIKQKMSRPITVIVIFNNIFNIVGSIFVGAVATKVLGSALLGAVSALMTFLIVIFGEIIPKTIGENYSQTISCMVARPLLFITKVFSPIIWFLEKTTERFAKPRKIVSEEELQILSHLGHLEGSIKKDERDMIKRVFNLDDITAKDIMTPRTVIKSFSVDSTLGKLEKTIYTLPYSRIPVYSKNLDYIVGVCQRMDLLVALSKGHRKAKIGDLVHKAMFVSEDMRVDKLLPMFQKSRQHLAIVRDEFGGTSGIVTLEDVLEQLVGEIVDETDRYVDLREAARNSKKKKRDSKKKKGK